MAKLVGGADSAGDIWPAAGGLASPAGEITNKTTSERGDRELG